MYIPLDRNSKTSLTKQIYLCIKTMIMEGILIEFEKLPSSRNLALSLNISRTIVVDAYEQLLAEGYIYSLGGSGTFVSQGIVFTKALPEFEEAKEINTFLYPEYIKNLKFRLGVPDLDKVPTALWGRLYREVIESLDYQQLDYHNPMGDYGLRREIANYLKRIRGVISNPNNIIITSGAAQGFSLLKALVSDKEYVLVENPVSKGIIKNFTASNILFKPIGVDKQGIITSELPKVAPKLIITTPSHQFPTGVVMSIKRRIELINYARSNETYIVEDDYDSEYRYGGEPIQALQSLDPSKVIYIGSFSKTFCPAIRLGYLILPNNLVEILQHAKYGADIHSSLIEQVVMSKFIGNGYFEKHIRKMKKVYYKRRDFLISQLNELFGDQIKISGISAGIHLVIRFDNIIEDSNIIKKLEDKGIYSESISGYDIVKEIDDMKSEKQPLSLALGFGNMNDDDVRKGLNILWQTLNNYK